MLGRMLRRSAAAVLLWGAAAAVQADAGGLTAAEVAAELRTRPAGEVLARHFGCLAPRGEGYARVAEGGAGWVALAARLLAASDACHTEGLQSALGEAMRRRPQEVLPLVGRRPELAAERICLPFVSAELAPAERLRQLRLSRRALERVDDPGLAPQRQACLRFIGQVEGELQAPGPDRP